MTLISKTLISNKEWIIKQENSKIGSITKSKKGFSFLKKGQRIQFKNIQEIQEQFGIELSDDFQKSKSTTIGYEIYNFPCSSKPYKSVFNLKKKLPLFAKSSKSKSQYCAGHYLIKFRKGWVKSFCPKLITLERYPYQGPFKSEQELKIALSNNSKYETS